MTPMPDDPIQEVAALHAPRWRKAGGTPVCQRDNQHWPCDMARVLAIIQTQDRDMETDRDMERAERIRLAELVENPDD